MKINFSAWSIHRPLPAILGFTLISIAGLFAFNNLPVSDTFEIDFPAVTVSVSYPGASPAQIETEITRKIENSLANITKIEELRTTISEGSSFTMVQFELEKDINVAVNDVRDAITRVRAQLPDQINEPQISRVEMAGMPMLTYAVSSPNMNVAEISWHVDDTVSRRLMSIPGVGSVTRIGGVDREIRVDLRPDRLLAFGVTAAEVSSQLRRIHADRAGGRTTLSGGEQAVRTISTVQDATAIRSLPIVLNDGRRVRLDELASVEDRYAEPRQLALLNGESVIGFQVTRSQGSDLINVATQTRAAMTAFNASHPNFVAEEVANSVNAVEDNFDSSMHMLYEGGILAIIVVFFFLRDWRATWVSAIALPLSVIPTFWVMSLFGYSLNTITLLALTLVVGILVDDAIVEIENIVRHLREGKSPKQAALDAADEIGLAVIATSLTLVAVFLPVAFMPGVSGQIFKQFAVTAVTAVVFSLLVARLLTPMIAAFQLKDFPDHEQQGPWTKGYLNLVHWTLVHRRQTLAIAALLFIVPMVALMFVPRGYMPSEDRDQLNITFELPPGSSLTDMRRAAEGLNLIAKRHPEVTSVFVTAGGAQLSNARAILNLQPRADRELSQADVQQILQKEFTEIPAARFSFSAEMGGGDRLQVVLRSDDAALLDRTVESAEREIRAIPGIGALKSSATLTRPEFRIVPDLERAAELGITSDTISEAIRIGTTGDVDFRLPKLDLPTRQIPIRVQLEESSRNQADILRLLRIPTRRGSVPLEAVAKLEMSSGPAQITHFNRARNVTLDIEPGAHELGQASSLVYNLPTLKNLPPGVERVAGGQSRQMQQMMVGFVVAMALGVFCVYAVLVLLFNDILQPLTILIALPLSLGGAVGGLLLFGYPLAMPALIGLLMLMGIAVKNSILLVDYAVLAERRGLSRHDALIDACSKRARPIVMTSIAMAAGMAPVALNLGGGGGFRSPMGVAVVGGLLTSTILSLLVIPAAYTYVSDFENWIRKLRGVPTHGIPEPARIEQ
jgi:hydrophobe/amphiphile efflux-1 (HAE1) family protein